LSPESIKTLRDLLESGAVIPQIDSEWALADAIDGAKTLESGRAAGKIIIKCCD
jgi:NADPH:quinone reductase-like Zn-dependent oxidoreductase